MLRRSLGAAISLGALGLPLVANAEMAIFAGAESGYTDIGLAELDDDTGEKVYAGFMFADSWGIEASVGSLGEFENNRPNANSSVEVSSVKHVVFVFEGTVFSSLSAFAKAGAYQASIEPHIPNGTSEDSEEKGFTYGAGLAYNVIDQFAVTASWQYYHQVEDVKLSMYSLGARFKF